MNVTIISGTFPNLRCGVGDYTYWLCSGLVKHNIEINIITSQNKNVKTLKEAKVYPLIKKWNFPSTIYLIRSLKKISPDLVHIQYPTQSYKDKSMINFFPLFFKLIFLGTPLILTIHDIKTAHPLNKLRLIPFFIFADKLIVTTEEEKDYLIKRMPFLNSKLKTIPLGSNIRTHEITEDEKQRIRLNFGIKKDDILISHFGYILPKKNLETLLYTLRRLLDTGYRIKLMMISDFSPDKNEYHGRLKKTADKLNLNQDIIWTGYCDQEIVSHYLYSSDINVQIYADGVSYRRTSFLAALCHGLPTVTTVTGELPGGLKDHYNVLAIPPQNIEGLVGALKELIMSNDLRKKLADNTKNLAERFSWENIAKEHFELYCSLLQK